MTAKMPKDLSGFATGYQGFYEQFYQQSDCYDDLVDNGQHPKALVIACCDSRVDPAILMNALPGDFFTVRNIANLVPPFSKSDQPCDVSAALLYGVMSLNIKNIVVMGHRFCGGIQALMTQTPEDELNPIYHWINSATPAKEKVLAEHSDCSDTEKFQHCEKASVVNSLDNLLSYPWVKEKVDNNELALHGWYFDLESGAILRYDEAGSKAFIPLLDSSSNSPS